MTPEHLSNTTIEAYVDGELPEDLLAAARAHLAECPRCRDAAQSLSAVAHTVAVAAPEDCLFCASGQFWDRLSFRLATVIERESPYALVALLPPLLLAALGFGIALLSWLVSISTLLVWSGVIPPLAQLAIAQSASPETPIVVRWMLDAFHAIIGAYRGASATLPSPARSVIQFGLVQGLLSLGLAITVALFALWAACLPDCPPTRGGTSA
jgi:anti-sigma factor RsiW